MGEISLMKIGMIESLMGISLVEREREGGRQSAIEISTEIQ